MANIRHVDLAKGFANSLLGLKGHHVVLERKFLCRILIFTLLIR